MEGRGAEQIAVARLPMMGITTRRDVWLNATFGTGCQSCGAEVARIQRRSLRRANLRRNSRKRRFGLLAIVGMIGACASHNEQTLLIDRHLGVVILLKTGMCRAFHDA